MADATAAFFDELTRRGHEPSLETVIGRARFDITRERHTEHWLVEIANGDIRVSQDSGPADCVIGVDRTLFDAIATGRMNAMAALLRGGLALEGDPEMLVLFQRLIPGPSGSRDTQPSRDAQPATAAGGRSS